jgi:hypothetical protein
MFVSLAITINVLLSVALIGGLTYVMSLARHLTSHVPGGKAAISSEKEPSLHPESPAPAGGAGRCVSLA